MNGISDITIYIDGLITYIGMFACICFLNIANIKRKRTVFLALVIMIPVIYMSMTFKGVNLVFILTAFFILLINEKNSVMKSLISIAVVVFLYFLMDAIIYTLIAKIVTVLNTDINVDGMFCRMTMDFVILVLSIIICAVIGKKIKKERLKNSNIKSIINQKYKWILILAVIVIVMCWGTVICIRFVQSGGDYLTLVALIVISYLIIAVIITFAGYERVNEQVEFITKQNELKTLQEYNENLEALYNDMRSFRHDYVNILSSMTGYLEDDDIKGLKKYFNDKILPLGSAISKRNSKIGLLQNIKIKEIKGVVLTKILRAQELGIDVDIDIEEKIEKINFDMVDLCRCLGIFLDNAIESANDCEKGIIKIGFVSKEGTLAIIIINSIAKEVPPIHKIFEKGFSTKGTGRGLGLSNVRQTLFKYSNVTLDTNVEEETFTQILEIR